MSLTTNRVGGKVISNLEKYKTDLDALVKTGDMLSLSLQRYAYGDQFDNMVKKQLGDKATEYLKNVPKFTSDYQAWYSEAKSLIRQLLPDRLADFVRHYEKPKPRKDINFENYRIEDALQGLTITRGYEKQKVVASEGAIPHLDQQLAILKSVKARFESSLFDIRQLVQADLFDSELDAAGELLRQKFNRAAGALAGVVLERHLAQVCENHSIKITKKNPGISDLNELLKGGGVIDVPQWRFNQHLADIRNLCDHSKTVEPTSEQVSDLLSGVMKVTKTIF
jgi:hypothetical protein